MCIDFLIQGALLWNKTFRTNYVLTVVGKSLFVEKCEVLVYSRTNPSFDGGQPYWLKLVRNAVWLYGLGFSTLTVCPNDLVDAGLNDYSFCCGFRCSVAGQDSDR